MGVCTFRYTYILRKVICSLSLNPEYVHGYLLLLLFTGNIYIKLLGFPTKSSTEWGGGGFVRLVHSNFEEGSFSFVVVSFINRWLIAASHFYFWKNSFKSNSEVFPPNQALSGDLYV